MPKPGDDHEESSIDDFEDFDPEDYLNEETTEELDFSTDERYRGDNDTLVRDTVGPEDEVSEDVLDG